jgi:hypothetical protein
MSELPGYVEDSPEPKKFVETVAASLEKDMPIDLLDPHGSWADPAITAAAVEALCEKRWEKLSDQYKAALEEAEANVGSDANFYNSVYTPTACPASKPDPRQPTLDVFWKVSPPTEKRTETQPEHAGGTQAAAVDDDTDDSGCDDDDTDDSGCDENDNDDSGTEMDVGESEQVACLIMLRVCLSGVFV